MTSTDNYRLVRRSMIALLLNYAVTTTDTAKSSLQLTFGKWSSTQVHRSTALLDCHHARSESVFQCPPLPCG
jgi:hypothetical protein